MDKAVKALHIPLTTVWRLISTVFMVEHFYQLTIYRLSERYPHIVSALNLYLIQKLADSNNNLGAKIHNKCDAPKEILDQFHCRHDRRVCQHGVP